MRDGSFCALLVAAAEPSNTERTVPSVCDSHGSDFGCLSHANQGDTWGEIEVNPESWTQLKGSDET